MKIFADYSICGIDEVGRGCLAGVVCASAVIFKGNYRGRGLKDSKLMTHAERVERSHEIKENSYFAIATSSVEEIDELNILQATFVAMKRAVVDLETQFKNMKLASEFKPVHYVVDGRDRIPDFGKRLQKSIIQGDQLIKQISAASIVAKVYRDQMMVDLDQLFPEYGFCKHKGYGTKIHIEALQKFGALPIHRKSFGPVREVIERRADSQVSSIRSNKSLQFPISN